MNHVFALLNCGIHEPMDLVLLDTTLHRHPHILFRRSIARLLIRNLKSGSKMYQQLKFNNDNKLYMLLLVSDSTRLRSLFSKLRYIS
jgi:hypothetical protein